MRSLRRLLVASLGVAALAVPAAPASADGWVLIGSGEAAAYGSSGDLTVVTSLLDAGRVTCVPRHLESRSLGLTWQTWYNAEQVKVAYNWYAPGEVTVSSNCASAVTACIRVSDYAPAGRPAAIRGPQACRTATTAREGVITSLTETRLWVDYYDGLAQRGSSLVEVAVSGSYRDRQTGTTVPAPCIVVYYQVTPTPAGPIVNGPSEPQPCVA